MENTLDYARKRLKWYSKELNELIFSQPYTKAAAIGEIIGRNSRTTLTKYLDELVVLQILRRSKLGNEVYYINDDLLRILEK